MDGRGFGRRELAITNLANAAPDLLASLKEVLPFVPGWNQLDFAGRPWLQRAQDAIDKASLVTCEGVQP